MNRDPPTLVRIPFSHYCQKVEWALTYHNIAYECVDVMPWKMANATKAGGAGTVPILVADTILTESQDIMAWIPDQASLYPSKAVRAWEDDADESLGPAARREAYRVAYNDPLKFLAPLHVRLALRVGKPFILKVLKYYKARRFEDADEGVIREWIAKTVAQVGDKPYLFEDHPTAADFATAALAKPILWTTKARDYAAHPDWNEFVAYMHRVKPHETGMVSKRKVRDGDWAWLEANQAQAASID